MKLNEIQDLIKFVSKSGVSEVELETKEIKIVIKTTSKNSSQVVYQAAPVVQAAPQVMTAPQQQAVATPQTNTATPEAKTPAAND